MGFEKQQRYSLSWRILPWLSSSGDINNHQDPPPSFQRRTQDSVIAPLGNKLIKIGANVVRHGRYVTFQLAEVAISRALFAEILRLIDRLRPAPLPP